jgi:hypothetical protein
MTPRHSPVTWGGGRGIRGGCGGFGQGFHQMEADRSQPKAVERAVEHRDAGGSMNAVLWLGSGLEDFRVFLKQQY